MRRNIEPYRGYWDIPGGHCDAGEHPADTAVREAMEETGWAILITGIFGIWMDSEGEIDSLVVYYRARPTAQVRAPDAGETMELGWFEAAALPRNIAFPDHSRHVLAAWEPAVAVPVAPSDSD